MRRAVVVAGAAMVAIACGGSRPAPSVPPPSRSTTPPDEPRQAMIEVDRSKLPDPTPAPQWAPPVVRTWKLGNGIQVWFLEYGVTPLVSAKAVLDLGAATDPRGKAGLTSLMADLLDEGAGNRTALELDDEWQRLATSYGVATGTDGVTFTVDTLADNLRPALELLSDVLRRPALDAEEFRRRKEQAIAAEISREDRPTNARMVVLRRALFGSGYGGFAPTGTRRTLERITLADVEKQFSRLIVPERASLVVVGGIDEQTVRPILEATFGDWTGTTKATPAPLASHEPKSGVHFIDYPGKTQSAVALARRIPGMADPDYFDALVVNRVLGGQFTSRLNLNLREDKGFTYGAGSSFHRWRSAGFLVLAAQVKTETTRAAVGEMSRELGALCEARPITTQERNDAVDGLLLGFPGRFERVSRVAEQVAELPLYDRAPDWYAKWPDRVRAVDVDAANRVARKYCDPTRAIVVVAGDRAKVVPTLADLSLPVSYYDHQGHRKR